ncbi:hypothetical protein GCM10022246_24800 [Pedobacter ginsengiterrae]|uniref:Uncharacterized protein n=1 Tax=Pedobacter ginsengiterrae TaxID=871696 RepID=A0ABP7PU95_9SPHI
MSRPYKIHNLFENTDSLLIELKEFDLALPEEVSMVNHWLLYDKISEAMIKLWLRSVDSSSEIEERYFEQGYLKFNKIEATYIEKFNSAQHKLYRKSELQVSEQMIDLIAGYFKTF